MPCKTGKFIKIYIVKKSGKKIGTLQAVGKATDQKKKTIEEINNNWINK